MTDETRGRSTGIRISGGSDNIVSDNRIIGFDDGIAAENTNKLTSERNDIRGPEPKEPAKSRFYEGLSAWSTLAGTVIALSAFGVGLVKCTP